MNTEALEPKKSPVCCKHQKYLMLLHAKVKRYTWTHWKASKKARHYHLGQHYQAPYISIYTRVRKCTEKKIDKSIPYAQSWRLRGFNWIALWIKCITRHVAPRSIRNKHNNKQSTEEKFVQTPWLRNREKSITADNPHLPSSHSLPLPFWRSE